MTPRQEMVVKNEQAAAEREVATVFSGWGESYSYEISRESSFFAYKILTIGSSWVTADKWRKNTLHTFVIPYTYFSENFFDCRRAKPRVGW